MGRPRRDDDDPPPARWRLCGKMAGWPDPGPKEGGGEGRTHGQVRRHRRNLMIALAHAAGMSERWIADALGLSHAQVNAVLKRFRDERATGA